MKNLNSEGKKNLNYGIKKIYLEGKSRNVLTRTQNSKEKKQHQKRKLRMMRNKVRINSELRGRDSLGRIAWCKFQILRKTNFRIVRWKFRILRKTTTLRIVQRKLRIAQQHSELREKKVKIGRCNFRNLRKKSELWYKLRIQRKSHQNQNM